MKVIRGQRSGITLKELESIGEWRLANNYIIVFQHGTYHYKLHKMPNAEDFAFLNVDNGRNWYGPTVTTVIGAIENHLDQGEVHVFETFKEFSDWVNNG